MTAIGAPRIRRDASMAVVVVDFPVRDQDEPIYSAFVQVRRHDGRWSKVAAFGHDEEVMRRVVDAGLFEDDRGRLQVDE